MGVRVIPLDCSCCITLAIFGGTLGVELNFTLGVFLAGNGDFFEDNGVFLAELGALGVEAEFSLFLASELEDFKGVYKY